MSVADEIEKLQRLKDQGALTEEEFAKAKAALLGGNTGGGNTGGAGRGAAEIGAEMNKAFRKLSRSKTDRWLGGVCGGLSELASIPSWALRLLFVLLSTFGGVGVIIYLLMWVFIPERPSQGG